MSSVLIKFKIDYKNKKTLVQIQPITDINEKKKGEIPKKAQHKNSKGLSYTTFH